MDLKEISLNPDTIDGFNAEQVAEARALLTDLHAQIRAGEVEVPAEALDEATTISAKLNERETKLAEELAEYEAKIAALEESLGITDEEVEVIEATIEGPDDEEDEEDEPEEAEAVVVEEEKELEPVVASATRPKLGAIAKAMPKDRKPKDDDSPYALVASAGPREGESLTASAFAEIAINRWQHMSTYEPYTIATIPTKHKYELRKGDDEHNTRVLAAVQVEASEKGNLVASGGFCAPPTVGYSFFNEATRAGILDLPTVNAPRGSISIPVSPSLGDFLGQSGIATEWTNENDIEPTTPATKAVYTFVCPTFQECEVSAWPTILQFGNFVGRFFPEAVANATGLAMIAADRALNVARLAFLASVDVAGDVNDTLGGTLVNLTHNLASNAADYRATYGMGFDAPLDIVLPHWLRDAAYADAITRDSTNGNALNAWLGAVFAELNLRPQFVYDLDPQTNGLFEAEATVYMFAPGTVVELDAGTLDLGVVRDSTLNSTNDYQTFVEPFVGWCVPGHEVRSLAIPVCANGSTGDRVTIDCPTVS